MSSVSNEQDVGDSFELPSRPKTTPGLERVVSRLVKRIERDELIQAVVPELRHSLDIDRVALYYFYRRWKGQVIFEALSQLSYSIFGMTGADDCFNDEYAALYEAGRYRAIDDIESEPIHDCHREFLNSIQVKSNLVVPILNPHGLWGLLAAHHCKEFRNWSGEDIELMQEGAEQLATSSTIRDEVL